MKIKLINYLAIPACSAVVSIVLGTLFSFITGYKSADIHLVLRLFVWIINITISYSLTFLMFKKINCVKFLNKISIIISIVASVILVVILSGDLECLYLTTLIAIFGIWEIIDHFINKNQKD
jgi:hypothetical protein